MPTLAYARGAVADLLAYLTANYPTFLTTINGEEGLSLAAPDVYRDFVHPAAVEQLAVEVTCQGFAVEDFHNKYWHWLCLVHLVLRGGDADLGKIQRDLRTYQSALIRCIEADPSLNQADVDAEITGGTFDGATLDGRLQGVVSTQITVKRQEAT